MKKSTKIIISVAALVVALALGGGLGFLLGRSGAQQVQPEQSAPANGAYTVEVRNAADMPMENIGVYIYTDSSLQDLETFANTDAEGKIRFEAKKLDTYVAVLQNVPAGYKPEAYYPITGEVTKIVLGGGEMTEEDMENIRYNLGDLMLDFTIVDTDGVEHKLSELLKTKRAVALNFWYIGCDPCKMEFPYVQEAYEEYSEVIEILAMNPMGQGNDAIAAYKEEMGLTFPMADVDPAWEKMMQITGYPTTVIIDRFGNIGLIHRGAVSDAKTLKDAFAFFTADDYESTTVEDIAELATEEPQGTESNPLEFGGVTSFEVTVDPGQTVHVNLYKVKNRYLQVKNKDCFIKYNDKEYKPSGGTVGFMVSAPDNYTPAKLQFTNNGTEKQTFKVTLSALRGSRDNPYTLEIGEFNASVSAGNDQGVYYRYTASKDGVLSLRCLQSSVSKYGFSLYNLNSYAMRNLEEDSESDDTGKYVKINVKKGQTVEVTIATLPDSSNNYPAGSFKFKAEFKEGLEDEEDKVEKLVYKVTVTDDQELAMPNVTVWFVKDSQSQSVVTDEHGVAALELEKGTYTVQLSVPEGYMLETDSFELTEEKYEITIALAPAVDTRLDYKVIVLDGFGEPVANVAVIIGSTALTTDETGVATVKLEPAVYSAIIVAPEGYIINPSMFTFAEGVSEITVELGFAEGTANNPLWITDLEQPTEAPVKAGKSVFYMGYLHETIMTIMDAPDVYVILDGVTYGADENGVVTLPMPAAAGVGRPMPVMFELGNAGTADATYKLYFRYPVGHSMNPQVLTDISSFTTSLEAGDSDGYNYLWTADAAGKLMLSIADEEAAKKSDISVYNTTSGILETLWFYNEETETDELVNPIEIDVAEGDVVKIQVVAKADENFQYPAHEVTVTGEVLLPPEEPTEPEETTTAPEETTDPEETTTAPEETTQPEVTEPEVTEPSSVTYSVTVVDDEGKPITSGVFVTFMKEGSMVDMKQLSDANGTVTTEQAPGTYTVSLAFSGNTYFYDETKTVLTAEKPSLTVAVAEKLSSSAEVTENFYIAKTIDVPLGASYLTINNSQVNYAVENGKGYCFFRFLISEPGVYRFSTSHNVPVTDWGTSTFFISNQTTEAEYAACSFDVTMKESNFSGEGDVKQQLIGVEVGSGNTILTVTRVGDVVLGVMDAPWTEFVSADAPKLTYNPETGSHTPTNSQIYKLSISSGQSLKYANLYSDTAVLGDDGLYHLNSKTGPVLYVDLGPNAPYISMYNMLGLTGFGGTSFRKIFYNTDGTPMMKDGNYVKEDYTAAMLAYTYHADKTYGVYPLNEDIVYMLQNGGEYMGWYDSDSESYLFTETATPVNEDLAWMFAVCYVE